MRGCPIKNPIQFGTDGWRGVIARDFTFENVRYCAQGLADYLSQAGLGERGVVIGYDNRFESEDFAAETAGVLAANGIKSRLCARAAPTPVVSFGALSLKAGGGVVITASHNQAVYNGFKIKTGTGSSAPDEMTRMVEDKINQAAAAGQVRSISRDEAVKRGLLEDIDLTPAYFAQLNRLVNIDSLRQAGVRVIADPMYGAGAGYLKELLAGGRTEVIEINSERNPLFPGMERPEPIAVNLGRLAAAVEARRANVGLATDGDADRMGIMDEKGNFLTQLQVFALLCLYLLEVRGERGPIVKTLTTTSMAYRLGELFNVPVYETAVGFKYVAPAMAAHNALIGGEESGGYGFRGHVLERDGILANLYFLDFMVRTGKRPSELLEYLYSKVGPHHYERQDILFPADRRAEIINNVKRSRPDVIMGVRVDRLDTTDGFRFILADNSWLLIRFSGTEPVLRVYAETGSRERAQQLIDFGRNLAGV
ncbi:MAG: phosphoglucomutase/phosphomannomutase family protein [Chloroflexi bacterium]|nr:phosphoglucomutase/phosphomannomutase family protein [Chloroflexota bacterium]